MRPSCCLAVIAASLSLPAMAAQSDLLTLQMNPFSRPEILKAKPPPAPTVVVVPAEEVELKLTATLVSAVAPMVMVDGELLAIGDRVAGFKLIRVMEGKAIFTRDGKRFTFEIDRRKFDSQD